MKDDKFNTMKVIKNFSGNYEEDPVRFLDFENYTKELNEGVEFYFGHPPSKQIFNKSNNFIFWAKLYLYLSELDILFPGAC